MRKFLSLFLCLIFIFCSVACEKVNTASDSESESAPKQEPLDKESPYSFISKEERLKWKDKIINVILANDLYEDYEILQHNFFGMALMDLNFDNTPEVIASYSGGSMGNVCIIAYDLMSGEELCFLLATPHFEDWNNVYFCYHRNDEGKYFIINEGALRDGLEWNNLTSSLNGQFEFDTFFNEVKSADNNIRYYCYGNQVEKADFEKQKNQFKNDEIKETQMQIVYWDTIDTQNKKDAISAMAEALVNSDQEFIDFNK